MKTLNATLRKSSTVVCFVLSITISLPVLADSNTPLPKGYVEVEIPYRNPNLAFGLSFFSTVILFGGGLLLEDELPNHWGGAMALLGVTIAPSTGLFYTGNTFRGILTTCGRAGALALAIGGLMSTGNDHGGEGGGSGGVLLSAVGGMGWLGLTIWDIVDARHSAVRFNQQARSLAFSPLVLPPPPGSPDSGASFGLALSGRF